MSGRVDRVTVDTDRCVGTGQCEMLAPAVFEVGDEGVVVLDAAAAGAADPALLHRAARTCPVSAITVTD